MINKELLELLLRLGQNEYFTSSIVSINNTQYLQLEGYVNDFYMGFEFLITCKPHMTNQCCNWNLMPIGMAEPTQNRIFATSVSFAIWDDSFINVPGL